MTWCHGTLPPCLLSLSVSVRVIIFYKTSINRELLILASLWCTSSNSHYLSNCTVVFNILTSLTAHESFIHTYEESSHAFIIVGIVFHHVVFFFGRNYDLSRKFFLNKSAAIQWQHKNCVKWCVNLPLQVFTHQEFCWWEIKSGGTLWENNHIAAFTQLGEHKINNHFTAS